MAEFVIEEIGVGANGLGGKKASTKVGMKTALGGESSINVDRRVRAAAVPIGAPLDDNCVIADEMSIDTFDLSGAVKHLMPRRPAWNFELSSGRLHFREAQLFQQWLADVRQLIADRGGYPAAFEQNLQVWRQLWRVLERCNVAVIVVDARHPLLHLPPALVFHIVRTLQKPAVIVLNKLDMVEPQVAARWAEVLRTCIPGVEGVIGYSKEPLRESEFAPLAIGKAALIAACHSAFVGASSGDAVTDNDCSQTKSVAERSQQKESTDVANESIEGATVSAAEAAPSSKVMLGLVGHPNVGKSSLLNALFGDKVVSVKATPGHTKTLQTMELDESTVLCDSPGVVFPRLEVPREAQIVGMLIPHGQVREPFSAIRWVMEHATKPLHELLSLKPVKLQQVLELRDAGTDALRLDSLSTADGAELDSDDVVPWSPMLLCAQYARQRGLVRHGRPDCQAAGMEILARVLEGRVPYSVKPPANSASAEQRARHYGTEGSDDEDSDWQVDDDEFESDQENEVDEKPQDLLTAFGEEGKVTGCNTNRSRKKEKRQKKLWELETGTSQKPTSAAQRLKFEEED